MNYRRLGSSDLEVSEISLGSWLTFAGGVGFDQVTNGDVRCTVNSPNRSTLRAFLQSHKVIC